MYRETKSKQLILLGIIFCLFCSCFQKKSEEKNTEVVSAPTEVVGEISIIPQPNIVKRLPGQFEINSETKIALRDELGINPSNLLNEILQQDYELTLGVINQTDERNQITLSVISSDAEDSFSEEEYYLKVDYNSIEIKGTERGVFYAIQSLSQIIKKQKDGNISVPGVEISDSPRFRFRAMHLDVSRHFMPITFVKKYISLMAYYKYNYFHWHLTDDQGWRIEIKKYPKLTEIGSKRKTTVVKKNYKSVEGDGIPITGFYTQEEIKEVVEFAKTKNITIIPEIDMPGHSSAALASYPQLGCKKNYNYKVKTTWGGFADIYCPTDVTFQFLEDVLSEIIDLFPNSPYIHIGGDEVKLDHWKESAFVQELKKKEGLLNEFEVQSWFIERIEKFVQSKGKKIIGWDEVINKRLSNEATIMAWQGVDRVVEAAKIKREVIATPSDFTYFDHPQGNPDLEPMSLGSPVTLDTVYGYDPIPEGLSEEESKYVIGGVGCVWTEFLKGPRSVEYMAFPRSIAFAEVLWSKQENRNFDNFLERLKKEFTRLDKEKVNYRIPEPQGLLSQNFLPNQKTIIDIKPSVPSGKIFYTIDGTEPTIQSNIYQEPLKLDLQPNQAVELKTIVLNSRGRVSTVFSTKYKQ